MWPSLFAHEGTTLNELSHAFSSSGVLYKYPNPQATHVVSVDTISQQYDEASGKVRLERILGVRQGAPRWVVKVSEEKQASRSRVDTFSRSAH